MDEKLKHDVFEVIERTWPTIKSVNKAADEIMQLFATHLQAAVQAALNDLNKQSKLLQDPYKGKNNAMSVAYRRGAQDAHDVWRGQIEECLAQLKKEASK